MILKILNIEEKFAFQKLGNGRLIYNNFIQTAPRDVVITWNFNVQNGLALTTYEARKVNIISDTVYTCKTIDLINNDFVEVIGDNSVYYQNANDLLLTNLSNGFYYIYFTDGTFERKTELFEIKAIDDFDGVECSDFNVPNYTIESGIQSYYNNSVTISRIGIDTSKAISGVVKFVYTYTDTAQIDVKQFLIDVGETSVIIYSNAPIPLYLESGTYIASISSPCAISTDLIISKIDWILDEGDWNDNAFWIDLDKYWIDNLV
jgi:hypothetical protein